MRVTFKIDLSDQVSLTFPGYTQMKVCRSVKVWIALSLIRYRMRCDKMIFAIRFRFLCTPVFKFIRYIIIEPVLVALPNFNQAILEWRTICFINYALQVKQFTRITDWVNIFSDWSARPVEWSQNITCGRTVSDEMIFVPGNISNTLNLAIWFLLLSVDV